MPMASLRPYGLFSIDPTGFEPTKMTGSDDLGT